MKCTKKLKAKAVSRRSHLEFGSIQRLKHCTRSVVGKEKIHGKDGEKIFTTIITTFSVITLIMITIRPEA